MIVWVNKVQKPNSSQHSVFTKAQDISTAEIYIIVMVIVFWDTEGIIHNNYVQQGSTMNANYYCDVLDKLHGAIRKSLQKKLVKTSCFFRTTLRVTKRLSQWRNWTS